MNIYDNEITSKIYPDLNPTAPQKQQTYQLKKLTEIEAYLVDDIEVRELIAKKMKRFSTITSIVDTGLITSIVITEGVSIAAFASGVGLPVGVALSEISLLLSLATVITRKSFKTFTAKQEKHDAIKLLAQSKLDRIADIISQVRQDGDISSIEFHEVLQEVEKYLKLIKQITEKQQEELLEQGRFFTKNCKYFRYPGCQYHLKHEAPPPYSMGFYGLQRL